MSRITPLQVLRVAIAAVLSMILVSCGGGGSAPKITVPPPSTYSLTASALTPASVNAGTAAKATSTITVTPSNGYQGVVTLSCTVTGNGTPLPTCAFSAPTISITSTSAGTATLTVSTSGTTSAAGYTIAVTGKDASNNAPNNGVQSLSLTVASSGSASYAVTASTLSPNAVVAPSSATSTITVTPANGYTGNVTLSCSSISGGATPDPTCSFNPSTVPITSGAGTSTLTVSTTTSTPSAAYAISVTGKDASNQAPSNGAQSISLTVKFQHIVLIVQENRTPDNMFQDPVLIAAGADITKSAKASTGAVTLQSTTLGVEYDISHENQAWVTMCDKSGSNCLMDHADLISPVTCSKGATNCPPTSPPPEYYYVQQSDVQPYWDMAEQFTFGDHMFQTNQGPSYPAHQFLIGGTSEPTVGSNLFVAENPLGVPSSSANAGCTAPSAEFVYLIDPNGSETTNAAIYPCMEHPSLTDELDTASVTWRYYAPLAGSIWTAPTAIEHICVPNNPPPNGTACTGTDYINNVALSPGGVGNPPILTDISAGQLRQVSWVIPTGSNSDHAGQTTTTGGPSWVASIVNAIAGSAYWSNTAIIIIWDDWGGWYDHVPPPKVVTDGSWGSGYTYGFRVPLIVVSPLAKPKYISQTPHDFGSILRFIEKNFDVPALGFADTNALDDLSDCFNFSQVLNPPPAIKAPLKADYFIHDRQPATGPDDD